MSNSQKPACFVIAPIGPKDSEIRKRSDKVLKHIFRKALAEKYDVIRGDEIDEPGMITSQVLRAVQESALVVADLTGHNPNVLYELAVRHAIEKPVIHVIEPKLSKIPFDIAGFRTIEFDLTDPDSIESAVEQLKKQTEQAEKGKWGETPVKLANIMTRSNADSQDTVLLKEAVQGVSRLHQNMFELVNDLGARIDRVQATIGYPTNVHYIWDTQAASPSGFAPKTVAGLDALRERAGAKEDDTGNR
jgi:DNA-binding protein Fis